MSTVLNIKNMVCPRCVSAVKSALEEKGYTVSGVSLGIAEVSQDLSPQEIQQIGEKFKTLGFELLDDKKQKTIERVKNLIVSYVHYSDGVQNKNLSQYLTENLHCDYSTLSKLFSEQTNTTIEKYLIAQKTEKVKELLSYGELSLKEIAYKLNYSSSGYLSAQFKAETGMTPSQYKALKTKNRNFLDKI